MGLLPAMDLCIFMENAACNIMDFCSATFYIFILQQTWKEVEQYGHRPK